MIIVAYNHKEITCFLKLLYFSTPPYLDSSIIPVYQKFVISIVTNFLQSEFHIVSSARANNDKLCVN